MNTNMQQILDECTTREACLAKIAECEARLTQPKPTELFISDIHGEYEPLPKVIAQFSASRIHMLGDVYDRGPSPELIMDELASLDNIDIQWGNHDMLWMGAAAGQPGCVCNVVRICARYNNLGILEDAYGMNLEPLRNFAAQAYDGDPCVAFTPKGSNGLPAEVVAQARKVQKAIAIIQFKAEAQLIAENPSFELEDRNLLHMVDYEAGTVKLDGVTYPLLDDVFPTVDPSSPYTLTQGEQEVLQSLIEEFTGCEKLQRHMKLFLEEGSLYKICNNHLLYHACVPLNPDGTLMQVQLFGKTFAGRALFDEVDRLVRAAYLETNPAKRKQGLDLIWYLWLGQGSPLFAKSKMATFELYLIEDKAARKEVKNPYYSLLNDPSVLTRIFEDFGMNASCSRIVSGHTPVKVKDGEDPVKCGGKAVIIDGGFSHAYQPTTGLAGFALVSDAEGEVLHSLCQGCEGKPTMDYTTRVLDKPTRALTVADTDEGRELVQLIDALKAKLEALS